jgi:Carboxypeptidase regulatory-like domain/TonB dependent receptor-like, beta-barrel
MVLSPSSRLAVLSIVFFLVAGVVSPANGQTETATIYGSVTDPTGAVVPSATVRLIDTDRGLKSEVATGSSGFYSFPDVRPGHYRMEVEKSGFKLARLTEITVNVQDNLEQNFKLDVGSASEAITVQANAVNVNTTDGTVSTVVDRTFADNLPLNGRSFQTLIILTPGVVVTQTAYDDQGQFSVNGQRADANYFTVDGVSANFGVNGFLAPFQAAGGGLPALSASGGTNSLVSVEAMQEFRVQTSSFAPEFGRTPGGQISIATRSGTNAFHGSLFEYFRNDVLDANDWFNGYTNNPPLPKAEERQNDFGGVFGGPIIKDKTFLFFSYEGLRLRLPSTLETIVPDTTSRQQAPATMQPFLNAYPIPNGSEVFASCTPNLGICPPSGQAPTGLAQFNASYSIPSSLNAYSIRVDHTVNSKISLFGRYNYSPSSFDQRTNSLSSLPDLSTIQSFSYSIHTFTLGLTALLKPQIVNEFRANYSNDKVMEKYGLDTFGGAVSPSDSVLFPPGFSSSNSEFDFIILGAGEYLKGKSGVNEQRQLNFIDNLSVATGPHQLKFGVDYRWLSPFDSPLNYYQLAEFQGMTTCSAQGCAVQAGNALSSTASYADVQAEQSAALLTHNLSLYGQDTWKITPRLTLTYGLRWEINPPLKGKNSQNQPFTVNGLNNPATMTLAPRGTPLYDTTYGNVAPRIGLAYQLHGQANWGAVLRGGFGIFYDLGYGSLGGIASYFPFRANKFPTASTSCPSNYAGICFPLTSDNAAPPVITTNPPYSQMLVADRHLDLPRSYEWNAALEQSLGSRQSFSLTYVGAVGRDLLRSTVLFHPNQDFRYVNVTSNSATSDYNALQAKFERRMSQGLQALASYTWSHSIDIASTDAVANYVNTPSFIGNPNIDRGNSDFDIRHSFSAGVTYNLPTPGWNNVARAALGGWSADSFIFARSAPPVNVIGGYSFAAGTILRARPDVVPGVPLELYGSQYPGGKAFNNTIVPGACPGGLNQVGAWCPVSSGQGDFGRNALRGYGASQVDLAFQRQFHLTERIQLRFRGEFFNIFNHPNFGPPIGDLTSSQFGYSTATLASSLGPGGANGGLSPLYQIGGPRSIQLALKLQF